MTAVPTCAVVVTGTRASLAGGPAVTVNVAVALVSPAALAVIVALPAVVAVKLVVATPVIGETGEGGLKEPETPLTAKVIGLVAVPTVLPFAS